MSAVPKSRAGDYTMIDPRRHPAVEPCCVCGSKPQVWRYSDTEDSSMPPPSFYRPRIVEAVQYWNAYQRAALAMRGV